MHEIMLSVNMSVTRAVCVTIAGLWNMANLIKYCEFGNSREDFICVKLLAKFRENKPLAI